jgi:DNA-binding response OmpR family regulator
MGGQRVLIVDDDRLMRQMIRDTLERAGFEVETASEGDEAFRIMPAFDPDVVVLDVIMPGENGYRVSRAIKQARTIAAPRAPRVLLLTSRRVDDEAEREGVLMGFSRADGMMYKPVEPKMLVDAVTKLMAVERP